MLERGSAAHAHLLAHSCPLSVPLEPRAELGVRLAHRSRLRFARVSPFPGPGPGGELLLREGDHARGGRGAVGAGLGLRGVPRTSPARGAGDPGEATSRTAHRHCRDRQPRLSGIRAAVAFRPSDSRTSAGTGNARAMGANDARGRDVGEAVIAALHPFAPLGTSGGFVRGAGRLDISSRTLRGSPDLLCKLRSSTRIECEDRVNVSRVKK